MIRPSCLKSSAVLLTVLSGLAAACGDDSSPKAVSTPDPSTATGRTSDAATTVGADGGVASVPSLVTIADGPLSGLALGSTHQFLGIPYAKPPIGDLRFQPPQANAPWMATRDATQFGKRCAQLASAVLMNAASSDEDCLYLNVWTPSPTGKAPVMVWIHGGGNVNGSANEPLPYVGGGLFYDGSHLAKNGVVVVSLNYRLGVLGFFSHKGLADEGGNVGNQGLLDQVAALKWVQSNIAKFGGDPDNVTIFGESAGSLDVCLHVASPKARGLFHKAISESGGCTTMQTTQADAQKSIDDFATQLGCTGTPAEALTCLRKKTTDELVTATTTTKFGPALDGTVFPDQPRALYDKGDIAKVPIILGSNMDEGTLFVSAQVTDEAGLRAAIGAQYGAASVDAIMAAYPIANYAAATPNPYQAVLARVVGDAILVCTTYDAAVRASAAGSSVFMYNFNIPVTVGTNLGATHGSELTYVFGTSKLFTAAGQASSDHMQRYWTNFAKTGDPNGGSDLKWPAFSGTANVRMNIAEPDFTVVNDFRASECAFWRAAYDQKFAAAAK